MNITNFNEVIDDSRGVLDRCTCCGDSLYVTGEIPAVIICEECRRAIPPSLCDVATDESEPGEAHALRLESGEVIPFLAAELKGGGFVTLYLDTEAALRSGALYSDATTLDVRLDAIHWCY
jgi:hypothetical protein